MVGRSGRNGIISQCGRVLGQLSPDISMSSKLLKVRYKSKEPLITSSTAHGVPSRRVWRCQLGRVAAAFMREALPWRMQIPQIHKQRKHLSAQNTPPGTRPAKFFTQSPPMSEPAKQEGGNVIKLDAKPKEEESKAKGRSLDTAYAEKVASRSRDVLHDACKLPCPA